MHRKQRSELRVRFNKCRLTNPPISATFAYGVRRVICALFDEAEYSLLRPLVDWLDYNGYALVTKRAKEFTDAYGNRGIKGDMDVEIAVDAMEMARKVDHIVLFSGDGDFRCLVEAMQREGVRVSVVSTLRSSPPMVADELRRQADAFIELADLVPEIARPPRRTEGYVPTPARPHFGHADYG